MFETVWPYLALTLVTAGVLPSLERSRGWRLFPVLLRPRVRRLYALAPGGE